MSQGHARNRNSAASLGTFHDEKGWRNTAVEASKWLPLNQTENRFCRGSSFPPPSPRELTGDS